MLLVDIKGYNDWWKNFFDQLIRNVIKIYQKKLRRWLHDWLLIRFFYKLIVIVLIKQQAHDADPKAIQQINFMKIKIEQNVHG